MSLFRESLNVNIVTLTTCKYFESYARQIAGPALAYRFDEIIRIDVSACVQNRHKQSYDTMT